MKEWLVRIDDEDDKEDVRSWGKRVEKGRMTEEEFDNRVKDILKED